MKKDKMHEDKYHAKMKVLQDLRKMAHEMMGEEMQEPSDEMGHAMKEVSVAAPDQEGLKHGLDMASDLLEDGDEEHVMSEDGSHEMPEDEEMESSEESPEELEAKIQELMAKKAALARK